MHNELLNAPTEAVAFEVPPIQEQHEREGFHVTDEKTANWVLGKIADRDAELARVKAWAAEALEDAAKEKARLLDRFGGELEAFASDALTGAKTKTLKLPNGSLSFRKQPDALEVVDEGALSVWAAANCPDARAVTIGFRLNELSSEQREFLFSVLREMDISPEQHVNVAILKTPLNDHFKSTGEVPPGCVHKPAEEKFYVK